MKAHQLKDLRESLKFGDVTTIAREIGTSATTVQQALRGEGTTPIKQLIIQHAQTIVKQRSDRQEQLKRLIAIQREARLSASDK